MIEVAHSIRGRLRIVVQDVQTATDVRAAALAIPFVTAATLNPVTGSLVITYDPTVGSAGELWSDLHHRVASVMPTVPPQLEPGSPERIGVGGGWHETVVAVAVDACVRYIVKRSAAVLLAAVI